MTVGMLLLILSLMNAVYWTVMGCKTVVTAARTSDPDKNTSIGVGIWAILFGLWPAVMMFLVRAGNTTTAIIVAAIGMLMGAVPIIVALLMRR